MIELKQIDGGLITPKDDALLYDFWLNEKSGIFEGCEVTHLGSNQLKIANGRGVICGRVFTIAEETIMANLSTSGTQSGRLIIRVDTSNTETPISFVTQVGGLPELVQEDINRDGTVYELLLATYTATEILITDLTPAAATVTNTPRPHTHSASDITSTLPISKGGTGSTTAAGALVNLGITSPSIALTHTRTGTVHTLTGLPTGNGVYTGQFVATADFTEGDTFAGGWVAKPNGEDTALPDKAFVTGDVVSVAISITGASKKLGFKPAGGGDLGLNDFCQPTEPASKDGVWLKTAAKEAVKKVVFDTNVWAAGQWQDPSLVTDMPEARSDACCAPVGNEIFIFGGMSGASSYLNTAIAYNPSTNTYRNLANMPGARSIACCALVGNEIFIFGGMSGASSYLNTAIAYNPTTNTYRTLANMPGTRGYTCCALVGNEIFIFGGYAGSYLNTAIAYNSTTNTYRTLADMPGGRGMAYCAPVGNEIFIFGGQDSGGHLSTAIAYNSTTNTYRTLADMPGARTIACCALVGDEIFIFGGMSGASSYLNTAIAYNPSTNTYRNLANMPGARSNACCALVGNEIFIFGGRDGSDYPTTVERYMLTAKQYPDSPTVIFYRLPKDFTLEASLVIGKLIDWLPVYFKDCMLFKDGNITFPELYIGDGTQWTLARAAQ